MTEHEPSQHSTRAPIGLIVGSYDGDIYDCMQLRRPGWRPDELILHWHVTEFAAHSPSERSTLVLHIYAQIDEPSETNNNELV